MIRDSLAGMDNTLVLQHKHFHSHSKTSEILRGGTDKDSYKLRLGFNE